MGGPGGIANLLKQGEKEKDWEEKKEDDDEEEETKGKRSNEEDIQDNLVLQEGIIVKECLVQSGFVTSTSSLLLCSSQYDVNIQGTHQPWYMAPKKLFIQHKYSTILEFVHPSEFPEKNSLS